MGRRPHIVKDNFGKPLYTTINGTIIRVQEDKRNNTYIVLRDKEKIKSSCELSLIARYWEEEVFRAQQSSDIQVYDTDIKIETIRHKGELVYRYSKEALEVIMNSDNPESFKKRYLTKISQEKAQLEKLQKKNQLDKMPRALMFLHTTTDKERTAQNYTIYALYQFEEDIPKYVEALKKDYPGVVVEGKYLKDIYWNSYSIMEEWIIHEFCEILRKDKYKVARLSQIEEFAYIDQLQPKPKLSLEKALDLYTSRTVKPLSAKTYRDAGNWFNEFIKITKKSLITDIDFDDIRYYYDKIYKKHLSKGLSTTWVNHRTQMIKTVFNYVRTQTSAGMALKKDLDNIMHWCRHVFTKIDGDTLNDAEPIPRETFHEMFNYACEVIKSQKWKAILLTALNCGCYCKDIEEKKKNDFDLSKKTLKMVRQKKKTIKVAALWDITVEALNEYWQNDNQSSEYAFISQKKGKYVAQSVRDYFNRRCQ